jgi:peptide methionine sulfoxide reductase msrA/msrB
LTKLFFEIHDPTQINRQGPDVGNQYRSEIFFLNMQQKKTAQKLITELQSKGYKVATKLSHAGKFWVAEDYHQDYYEKKKSTPYCHIYTKRF